MTMSNKVQANAGKIKADVTHAANVLLNEGEKRAHELYNEGLDKIDAMEGNLKEYSDDLLKKVQENPLTAVLVAAGVGFLVSMLLKK